MSGRVRLFLVVVVLAVAAAAPSADAAVLVRVTPTADAATVRVSVRVSATQARKARAELQVRRAHRWDRVARAAFARGRATLRYRPKSSRALRLRVVVRRGGRTVGTSRSWVAKLSPAEALPATPLPPPETLTTVPLAPAPAPTPAPTASPEPEPVPEIEERRLADHCLIEGTDRQVKCWGRNDGGALGDGTQIGRPYAAPVAGMRDARAVVSTGGGGCAAKTDGSVWCWGDNWSHQLGGPSPLTLVRSLTPVLVSGLTRVTSLVGGGEFACVNRLDRAPMCWGTLREGLFPGLPTVLERPTEIPALLGATIVSATNARVCVRWAAPPAGHDGAECLAPNPAEWGRTDAGEQYGASAEVLDLAAGDGASCALLPDDLVRCAGSARYTIADPADTYGDWSTERRFELTIPGVRDIAVSGGVGCAARGALPVRCWGAAPHKTTSTWDVPGSEGMQTVAGGFCGWHASGALRCWGGEGLVGGAAIPVTYDGDLALPALSSEMGCGLRDGRAECWGRTPGTSPTGYDDARLPTAIAGTGGVRDLAVTAQSACGRTDTDRLLCWGMRPADFTAPGEVGARSDDPPAVVPDLDHVIRTTAAEGNFCALRGGVGKGIVCLGLVRRAPWTPGTARNIEPGTEDATRLAIGDSLERGYGPQSLCFTPSAPQEVRCLRAGSTVPEKIAGTDGAVDVALGANHGCAIVSQGRVRCWGQADRRLGFSTSGFSYTERIPDAREVDGVSGATSLALAFDSSCAVLATGRVQCWGNNSADGVLGVPESTPQGSYGLVTVPRIDDAVAITSSVSTVCVTRSAHPLTCWGSNSYATPQPREADLWFTVPLLDETDLPPL